MHSLCVGGAEMLASRLARRLRQDYRFVFICLDELGALGRELRDEGFAVHVIGRRAGLDVDFPRRLAGLWRRLRVDVVHAHQYTPFFYALVARLLYRPASVLFTEHGRHYPDYPRRKRILANRLLLQRRDRLVGVGQAVRRALIDNEGLPADRVEVVYNGVALSSSASTEALRREVRAELGVGHDDLVLLQVARLDYLKDHATAIRTLHALRVRRPDAKLVLIGEGPERDGIEKLIAQLGLQADVRLLGLRQDVARLLGAADVFLLTSISEGIPLTIIEAMAAGVPVVATRVGGIPEMIEDGRSGLLAAAGDSETLAAQILKVANDSCLRAAMIHAAHARRQAMFSEENMSARYDAIYRQMLR